MINYSKAAEYMLIIFKINKFPIYHNEQVEFEIKNKIYLH